MYFSDEKQSTNIDREFNNKSNKIFNKKYFIIGLILLMIIIVIWLIFKFKTNNSYLILKGSTDIILYQDSNYIEYGYQAYNDQGKDLTEKVIVDNPVNPAVTGEYIVTYQLENIIKQRTVTIIPKNNQMTYLILKGLPTIYLKVGEPYQEPGYEILDTESYISSDQVTVNGQVNINKVGTYKLVYSLKKNDGVTITAERTVIVTDTNINLSYTPTNITNKNVTININVSDNYFDYMLLPNGNKDTTRNTTYTVTSNGTYNFIVYSKNGSKKTETITINNIDKTSPKITSCNGTITDNITTYTVTTTDNDIEKYVYNNKYTTTKKIYTINANVPNASLTVYDKAGNTSQLTCQSKVVTNYESPINPSGNEVIIKSSSTDTLKIWLEKKTRSSRTDYYVAHIWVKNPYNQLKSGVPNNFGQELLTPKDILNQAISRNNYQNKLIIGINGSGFVLAGVYDVSFYSANNAWNKTSVSPVVISEGKLLRNITNGRFPNARNHITYGIKQDGYLAYYTYTYGTNNNQQNIKTGQTILNDGVNNTWGFMPVLVANGQVMNNLGTDKNIRNAICQINKNNFVLITDIYSSGRDGFSFKELAEYMVSIGCQTGFNLDGGGSVAMMYKEKNSQTVSIITGNNRKIADILYFHE